MKRRIALAAALLLAGGCKVKEGRAPGNIPAGIDVAVTVDGQAAARADSAWLSARKPDFEDGEWRAWRLSALAGEAAEAAGTVVEVGDVDGQRSRLQAGPQAVPVLTFNRQGELVVMVLDPANPFPSFHGRGGNRGRGGEEDRVRNVTEIAVRTGSAPARTLFRVERGGAEVGGFGADDLAALPTVAFTPRDGEPVKAWSVRDIAKAIGAERIDLVRGRSGETAIDPAQWKDASRTPVLRRNSKGQLKFEWADAAGGPIEGPEVREVTAVRVAP